MRLGTWMGHEDEGSPTSKRELHGVSSDGECGWYACHDIATAGSSLAGNTTLQKAHEQRISCSTQHPCGDPASPSLSGSRHKFPLRTVKLAQSHMSHPGLHVIHTVILPQPFDIQEVLLCGTRLLPVHMKTTCTLQLLTSETRCHMYCGTHPLDICYMEPRAQWLSERWTGSSGGTAARTSAHTTHNGTVRNAYTHVCSVSAHSLCLLCNKLLSTLLLLLFFAHILGILACHIVRLGRASVQRFQTQRDTQPACAHRAAACSFMCSHAVAALQAPLAIGMAPCTRHAWRAWCQSLHTLQGWPLLHHPTHLFVSSMLITTSPLSPAEAPPSSSSR